MFRSGARWLARVTLLVVTGLLSTRQVAAAVDEASRPAQSVGVVEVTVRGSAEDLESIRSVIGPEDFHGAETRWLWREHWDLAELLGGGSEAEGVVVCWIDLSEPRKARLYFADPLRQRFLLRELSLPDGLSELGREAVAQVLSMSVAALLEDSRAGISRAEAARVLIEGPPRSGPHVQSDPSPAAASQPSDLSATTASIGAAPFYAVRLYSDEAAVVHGPGIAIGWVSDSEVLRSTIGMSAQYEFSRVYVADSVGLKWSTVALRSSFELLSRIGQTNMSAGARAGLGLDFTHVEPRTGRREEMVSLTAARTSTSLALSVGLAACSRLGQRLGACLQLYGDFYPTRVHYDLELADGLTRVFVPWRVRPGLSLAIVLR